MNENNSLPVIRKLAIPINFIRNTDRKREKSQEESTRYPLLFPETTEVPEKEGEDREYRKGKMMGATRRHVKNCSFSYSKQ